MIWLRRIGFGFAAVVALIAMAAALLIWTSLPQTSGAAVLPGPSADIEIRRDARGVPYIRAASESDAFFALGYVHAQDRLFQMELMRRLGAGRLAEVLGASALGSDRFMRTLGLYRHAEANVNMLEPDARAAIDSYSAGINAFLDTRSRPLPPEFQLLAYTPDPWRPADTMVWQKLMSLSLAGNWRDELLRSRLLKDLPAERVTALWPDLDPSSPTTLAAGPSEVPLGLAQTLLAQIDAHAPPTLASNVWVIDGQHTASGQPLLASDPHLGFQAPVLWYLARLEWPGGQLAGATAPGVPFTIIGHNGHAAWGMTTTHADLQDLFIERVTADGRYDTPDGPQAFAIREEVLDIRFGEPEALTVRTTRHGPVVSDLDAFSSATSPDIVLALSATMLRDDDGTANAVYAIGQSRTVAEIKAALAGFEGPQQNFMYADTSGGIGFSSPALVPIRKAGDGTVPVPGWSGDFDWQGWVSYDDLPHSLNPDGGRLVNANNRPVPPDYPHLIAATFPEGYRAQRILDLLQEIAPGAATWQDMLGIQIDSRSEMARDLLPFLINVVEPRSDTAKRALALLTAWDGTMDRARPEPILFLTWMDFVKEELLADDLGTAFTSFFGDHPILIRTALTDDPSWCSGTLGACSDVVSTAFERSLGWLSQRDETAAKDLSEWRWGDFHRARFSHPVFGFVPVLSGLTTLEIETDGADHTVNRGGFRSARGRAPFRHSHGAGLRAVFDLAGLDRSRFMIATGQSGHPASPHYDNLTEAWRDGETFALPPFDAVPADTVLTLQASQDR